MKKLLIIPLFLLAGCSDATQVTYDAQSDISELNDTIEDMQLEIDELNSKFDDMEYQISDLQDENEYLKSEIESLESYSYEYTPPQTQPKPVVKESIPEKPKENNPANCFTIGSSKEHVKSIMGSPDSVVLTSWWYGKQSWVSFDNNGLVKSFFNGGNNLKTK